MKKFFFGFAFLFLLALQKVHCDNWFICLGSFKEHSNAKVLEQTLSERRLDFFETKYIKNESEIFYRVLLRQKFNTREECYSAKSILFEMLNSVGIFDAFCIELPLAQTNFVFENNFENEILVEYFIEVVK